MKKLLTVLAICSFAACGGSGSSAPTDSAATVKADTSAAAAADSAKMMADSTKKMMDTTKKAADSAKK